MNWPSSLGAAHKLILSCKKSNGRLGGGEGIKEQTLSKFLFYQYFFIEFSARSFIL